jgi:hypothetical protein
MSFGKPTPSSQTSMATAWSSCVEVFDCDRACDPGRVSVFDRIGDELADEQPERHRLFCRKNEAEWEQAVD